MRCALLAPVIAVALAATPAFQNQAAPPDDLLVRIFLVQRERAAWQAVVDGDSEALGSMLADEFLYVSGWFDLNRDEVLEGVDGDHEDAVFEIRIRAYRKVGDTQIVNYELRGRDGDGEMEKTINTSVWMRRDGRWLLVFHQEVD